MLLSTPALWTVAAPLTIREALSGVAGSISLVAWMLLLLPQLIENYKNGRADGVSLAFLLCWQAGDLANLFGAIWAGLLPTVIALAGYFCIADIVLLSQVVYYNHINRRITSAEQHDPTEPLLSRRRSSAGLSRPRRSSARRRDSLSALLKPETNSYTHIVRNIFSILGVCAAGACGWFIAWKTGAWAVQDDGPEVSETPWGASFLGYLSAVLYLGARVPQILKNYRHKSCEGLSLLFFLLSLLGNLTYGAGIIFHSTQPNYLLENLPWLLGSLGTMIEDFVIFAQFRLYRAAGKDAESSSAVV